MMKSNADLPLNKPNPIHYIVDFPDWGLYHIIEVYVIDDNPDISSLPEYQRSQGPFVLVQNVQPPMMYPGVKSPTNTPYLYSMHYVFDDKLRALEYAQDHTPSAIIW
jgi:hypothetical protein